MDAISHLELLVLVKEVDDERFWSIQGDVSSDPLISLPKARSPIGAYSVVF